MNVLYSLIVQKTIQTILIDLRGVGMSKEVLKWCRNLIFSSKKLKISHQNLDKHGWKNLIADNYQIVNYQKEKKRKPEKMGTGFEPMTSAMPVQCSTN